MARIREFDTEKAVEAAMNAFRRNGYDGTSIQDLVDATGVGRGSLYAAFGSKEGLYLVAMDRYREYYALPLVEVLRDGAPGRELLRAVLVAAVDEVVRDGSRQACLIVGAAVGRVAHDPQVAAHVQSTTELLEDALYQVIAEAQADGQLSGKRDARDLARYLVVTMHGLRVMGAMNPDRASLMAVAEIALDALG
ncbi:TetR/AcrR family transcriptional regulator [Streptomyces sp. NBC_01707]|uniref:TetR/AcrR family transcriptional regulator n=1 Tax=unclassified Streptomyces TaxID=2593676 RepID=UPI0029B32416|nr:MULTISPECIES: TetR/AcrR family transcriptional regulator [unclassified Streptomyces]MDX3771788.1 TetR/AcrR family transcriptional regulator [Streptomyces sp. AK08-01B]MDX3821340.1 TetR/AcrR family transcriptional regulator [Streptomyces sp. AK08-01A]